MVQIMFDLGGGEEEEEGGQLSNSIKNFRRL